MDLEPRLGLLCSGGTISKEVADTVRAVIVRLADRWDLVLDEQNGGRMVTHLAMALMRIRRNEPIAPMDTGAFEELSQAACFPRAVEITADLIRWANLDLPETEWRFMVCHLCLLMDET